MPVRTHVPIALVSVTTVGAALALQARINGEFAVRLGPALLAALISTGIASVAVLSVVVGTGRWQAVRRLRSGEWRSWWLIGGLCGSVIVPTAAYAVPIIGVALLFVCQVAGQLSGGLLVDWAGIAPGGRRAVTPARVAAAVLALVAVLLSLSGKRVEIRPAIIALALLAGFLASVQQAANGHVRRHSEDVLVAVLVNFALATAGMLVGCAILALNNGLGPVTWPGHPAWLYVGGLLGAVFVGVTAAGVRILGVLRLTLAVVAGQLVGAVLIDLLWRDRSEPTIEVYAGIVLVLIAVALAGRSARAAQDLR